MDPKERKLIKARIEAHCKWNEADRKRNEAHREWNETEHEWVEADRKLRKYHESKAQ